MSYSEHLKFLLANLAINANVLKHELLELVKRDMSDYIWRRFIFLCFVLEFHEADVDDAVKLIPAEISKGLSNQVDYLVDSYLVLLDVIPFSHLIIDFFNRICWVVRDLNISRTHFLVQMVHDCPVIF